MINKVIFIFCFWASRFLFAAPCCGSTANTPSLITGDDETQVTTTITASSVVAEVNPSGKLKTRPESDRESAQGLRLDAATLLSDRFQIGLTLPTLRRNRERNTTQVEAMGLGDLSFQLAYELLPEWSYSDWQPKGFVFVGGTLPTGGSSYDSQMLYSIDSRGRGFYGASLGAFLMKNFGNLDFSLLLESHRYFQKTKLTDVGELVLSPGWGFSQTVNMGFSPGGSAFRLGLSLSHSHEDPVKTSGLFEGRGEPVSLWTPMVQLGFLAKRDLSFNVNFSDQRVLGNSKNTPLNQTLGVVIQKRWER
jgi:hypothetical protein